MEINYDDLSYESSEELCIEEESNQIEDTRTEKLYEIATNIRDYCEENLLSLFDRINRELIFIRALL